MKRWGCYFCCVATLLMGLAGCGKNATVTIDGAEVPLTNMEEKHWISVEGLQDYGFALQEGDKFTGSLETNWLLSPLALGVQTEDKKEIVLDGNSCEDQVYCNGVWIPTKVINGELMVSVEDLMGKRLERSYLTYGEMQENTEQLRQVRYGVYLVGKKEEGDGEWQLTPLRPDMPLRTPWGCVLFEKVLTDDIPFTAESFREEYISLPDLTENMGLSFVLHKGILHIHQDTTVDTYDVPQEMIPDDFLRQRLIAGYMLTGEGIRVGCIYDGKKLYANLQEMQKVLSVEGYVYDPERRCFSKKQ